MQFERGEGMIVETVRGVEYGKCEIANCMIAPDDSFMPLRRIVRKATEADGVKLAENKNREAEAFDIFFEKITDHGLKMKPIDVELTFDCSKIIFYFTADNRVDFRELVKDLAAVLRMRIELRQIGVRDESKLLNGIGICGRTLCCATFLEEFHPVSIKMAKDQNISLNPSKLTGMCSRLMCCLKYEEETYEELNKHMPNVGDTIRVAEGQGEVLSTSPLRQQVKAAIRKNVHEAPMINMYNVDELEIVRRAPVLD